MTKKSEDIMANAAVSQAIKNPTGVKNGALINLYDRLTHAQSNVRKARRALLDMARVEKYSKSKILAVCVLLSSILPEE